MKVLSSLPTIQRRIIKTLVAFCLIISNLIVINGVFAQPDNNIDDIAKLLRDNPELQVELQQALGQKPTPVVTSTPPPKPTPQQLQAEQLEQGLQEKAKMEQQIQDAAFGAVKREAFPLSPEQIKDLRNTLDDTQRASATEPYEKTPEPTSSSIMVNLSPGSTPPVIRLARGFVSSLVFIDSTGAPWPIKAYDLGNPNVFNISWNQKDNTLFVQALSSYTYGNLAVMLQDLDTPVMVTLVPGQMIVDYRVDLRLSGIGPKAKPTIQGIGLPDQADPTLLSILDGIPPKGAKTLLVENNAAQVWLIGEKIYVRTLYTLISPAWVAKMSSADGMNAYVMQKTPLLLLSRHGKVAQARLEGF